MLLYPTSNATIAKLAWAEQKHFCYYIFSHAITISLRLTCELQGIAYTILTKKERKKEREKEGKKERENSIQNDKVTSLSSLVLIIDMIAELMLVNNMNIRFKEPAS